MGLVLEFVLIVSVAQWDVNHSGVSDEGLIVECCSVSPSVMFVTAHHWVAATKIKPQISLYKGFWSNVPTFHFIYILLVSLYYREMSASCKRVEGWIEQIDFLCRFLRDGASFAVVFFVAEVKYKPGH